MGRLAGIWLQEGDQVHYSPQEFFNQYFLQAPYFAALEPMIFSTSGGGITLATSIKFWSDVATLADIYPAIQITPMLSFGSSTIGGSLDNWTNVQEWINALKTHPSIYSFGYGELIWQEKDLDAGRRLLT